LKLGKDSSAAAFFIFFATAARAGIISTDFFTQINSAGFNRRNPATSLYFSLTTIECSIPTSAIFSANTWIVPKLNRIGLLTLISEIGKFIFKFTSIKGFFLED
jgi:hypothetical protein